MIRNGNVRSTSEQGNEDFAKIFLYVTKSGVQLLFRAHLLSS